MKFYNSLHYHISVLYSQTDCYFIPFEFESKPSREWMPFAKRTVFLQAKSEDSFNAKNPRHEPRHPKCCQAMSDLQTSSFYVLLTSS